MLTTIQNSKLDYAAVKSASKILRALNHDLRQKIVKFISEKKETDVTSIYSSLFMQQSVASQHLAILRSAGIVKTERDGRMIMYSINHSRLSQVAKFVEDIMHSEMKEEEQAPVTVKKSPSWLLA